MRNSLVRWLSASAVLAVVAAFAPACRPDSAPAAVAAEDHPADMPAGLMARAAGMVQAVGMVRAGPIRQDMAPAAITRMEVDLPVERLSTSVHFDAFTITSTTTSLPSRRAEPPTMAVRGGVRGAAPAGFLTQSATDHRVADPRVVRPVVPIPRSITMDMVPRVDPRVVLLVDAYRPMEAQAPCNTGPTKSPRPTKGQ